MTPHFTTSICGKGLAVAGLTLALAACGEQEERTYEVDATDVSDGELIVATPTPAAPDIDLPDTPMTPVPESRVEQNEIEPTPAE